jgi:UDP-glucose 4-epimerase
MNILITGELTYTAKHTIKQMVNKGHRVRYGALDSAGNGTYDMVLRSPMFTTVTTTAPYRSVDANLVSTIG